MPRNRSRRWSKRIGKAVFSLTPAVSRRDPIFPSRPRCSPYRLWNVNVHDTRTMLSAPGRQYQSLRPFQRGFKSADRENQWKSRRCCAPPPTNALSVSRPLAAGKAITLEGSWDRSARGNRISCHEGRPFSTTQHRQWVADPEPDSSPLSSRKDVRLRPRTSALPEVNLQSAPESIGNFPVIMNQSSAAPERGRCVQRIGCVSRRRWVLGSHPLFSQRDENLRLTRQQNKPPQPLPAPVLQLVEGSGSAPHEKHGPCYDGPSKDWAAHGRADFIFFPWCPLPRARRGRASKIRSWPNVAAIATGKTAPPLATAGI